MTSHPPEWRKAWKLDDKAWVKQRRAEWKRVKEKLPIVAWFLDKSEQTSLKYYFMTGCGYNPEPPEKEWEKRHYNPNLPMAFGDAPLLFELWLNPDRSEESWHQILERYAMFEGKRSDGSFSPLSSVFGGSRNRFRELMRNDFPEEGNLFDGLEERLYRTFGPTRCRPEDYPELDRDAYLHTCWSVYVDLGKPLREYLNAEQINPDNIAPVFVREWCDTVPGGYEWKKLWCEEHKDPKHLDFILHQDIGGQIVRAHEIFMRPDAHDPRQLSVAREMLETLARLKLPDDLEEYLAPYLESAKSQYISED